MEAWRRVEVAACEEMEGPTEADLRGDPRRRRSPSRPCRSASASPTTTWPPSSTCCRQSAGPGGRWIHFGLTSSDVLDTALALQLQAAGEIVVAGARELVAALAARAREHADTVCVGRTHGVHAEPTTFGLKLAGLRLRGAPQRRAPGARVRAGERGGDQRRGRHLLGHQPGVRGARARAPGPRARGGVHPGRPARPPRRAAAGHRAGRRRARAARHRGPPPAAHRGARGRGAVPRRPAEGLERDAPQAQPDHHASASPGWRACCAATPRPPSRTSPCGTSATSRTRAPSA